MRNTGLKIVLHASWSLVGADIIHPGLQYRVIIFDTLPYVSDYTVLVGQFVVNMLNALLN